MSEIKSIPRVVPPWPFEVYALADMGRDIPAQMVSVCGCSLLKLGQEEVSINERANN